MQELDLILAAYQEINAAFELRKIRARKRKDSETFMAIAARQGINDQAYFVLCWGQVEKKISTACAKNHPDKNLARLSFKKRAELAFDGKNSPAWQFLMENYRLRNSIAHGELLAKRLELPKIIEVLSKILESL